MPNDFQFAPAVRQAVPMLISIAGTSGSGKTFSALLMAAGLAGPEGVVGFIDTENGRGSMYADSPSIVSALPRSYRITRLDPPFSPSRYIAAIEAAERANITVLVIDSTSHEWEGIDGCVEIAEKHKLRNMPNWSKAKMEHKRFVNHCLSSNMHIIFCLRARDKVKIAKDERGKEEFVPIGLQPIAEKNFVFEMLLSLQLDQQTHFANPLKVPEPLAGLFDGSRLITKRDGEMVREWNEKGRPLPAFERLKLRSRAAAEQGAQAYRDFIESLNDRARKALSGPIDEENRYLAEQADLAHERERQEQEELSSAEVA
jgi:hypothetical protein